MNRVVDIREKLSLFSEHWSPKVVARLNDYEVKVVKLEGEFVWHTHDDTDELFLVIEGDLPSSCATGRAPARGPAVRRAARRRALPGRRRRGAVMLIEPAGVVNTGDAGGDLTAASTTACSTRVAGPALGSRPWASRSPRAS